MQLKQYQAKTLEQLRKYLLAIKEARAKQAQAAALGIDFEWDKQAWKAVRNSPYTPHANGLGQPLPYVCLKVPTGGGKTLVAIKSLDAINSLYRGAQTGLALWIVPSTQIYNQTYRAFRDRAHPYRQELDMASGGRTLILEKDQVFSPEDVQANLCVLLLMLPSANRQNKETLKIFQDRGGFEAFFPPEDQPQAHAALLEGLPNLDAYGADAGVFSRLVKTSLGNTLRRLNPVIVLDEGHKAYGEIAQDTLRGFNPSFVLELSATPPAGSNVLVSISGQEVLRAGMIKLPINVGMKVSADWRNALRAAHDKRVELEQLAQTHREMVGDTIRPMCLIQVERTGEKQRIPRFVHAEDARDYLITQCNVPPEHIAVKSSERDEIENIDLLDADCPVRYIITKQALQEGWDCPFAYVLATLVNTQAPVSMTQLVGRVLRQPYARKTNVPALDESYVFFCKDRTGDLLRRVHASLHDEGLDDVQGGIRIYEDGPGQQAEMMDVSIRPQFSDYAGKVYFPCFVVSDTPGHFREIGYEMDILSRINFEKIDLGLFDTLELNPTETGDSTFRVGLEGPESPIHVTSAADLPLDLTLVTRQILDVVPNPWVAYAIAREAINRLRRRYSEDSIRRDLGYLIEELRKALVAGKNNQARDIFVELLNSEQLHFWLISGCAGNAVPDRIRAHAGRKLRYPQTDELPQRSLFDYVEEEFNETETAVALYLDGQRNLLAWFRNMVKTGYSVQGWQQGRVYPDFFAFLSELDPAGLRRLSSVRVLETKGLHLKNNEDTTYKQELFNLCNKYSEPKPWDEIAQQFADHTIKFHVIFEDEWQRVLNAMLSSP
ncbi:MAG TPA: DEAD/DEAH box helicase family protein [Anaerolineae bacterium]|nr:DEAD/DEAH box helicase family protein [Anaerolineae bacterium]